MVSLKSVGLMVAMFVPVVLLLILGWAYLKLHEARSELLLAEREWEHTELRQAGAVRLQQQLATVRSYEKELTGWGRSRVPWHIVLGAPPPQVPTNMQWRTLQMQQRFERDPDARLLRLHRLTIGGRSLGAQADAQVEIMRTVWENTPPLPQWVERAVVTVFEDDTTPGAAPEDRVFEIDIRFKPGRFHAATRE